MKIASTKSLIFSFISNFSFFRVGIKKKTMTQQSNKMGTEKTVTRTGIEKLVG